MQGFLPPAPEVRVLTQITESFHLSKDEAETALLLLKARAETLDMSFDEYLSTYHPKGFVVSDTSLPDDVKGYTAFLSGDARALIGAGKNADFFTFVHEAAHVFRRQLTGTLKEKAEKVFKVEESTWTEAQEEAFAFGLEQYIRLRLAASEDHHLVFEKGAAFIQRVYNGLDRIIPLNPEMIRVYDELFTAERFMFNQQRFDEAVDTISTQKDASRFAESHLYLGMTPPIYQELGFERLPVMITARHIQNIMQPEKEGSVPNYHGLTPEMIKQIPDALKKPLLVMQSQRSDSKEDIIAVVSLKDSEGRPIIIPLSPNKKGFFNGIEIDITLAKTIYGKDRFTTFLQKAVQEQRILYINEKSRELAIPELQLLRNYHSQLLYENIAAYHDSVKQKNPGIPLLYQKTAYYVGQQGAFDFLNDPVKQDAVAMSHSPHHTVSHIDIAADKKEADGIANANTLKIVNNTALKRVQLFFPDKPSDDVRSDLKAHGWRWSPRNFCWQRLNTENGLADAARIQKTWYPEKEEKQTPNIKLENVPPVSTEKQELPVTTERKEIVLTRKDFANAQKVIPPLQYRTTVAFARQSEDAEFFKGIIKTVSETVETDRTTSDKRRGRKQGHPILFRYFHPSGTEYYVSDIDKTNGEVYGFSILNGDLENAEWGYNSLDHLRSVPNIELDYHVPEGMTIERQLHKAYPSYFPEPEDEIKNRGKDLKKEMTQTPQPIVVAPLIQKGEYPPIQEVDWFEASRGSWNQFYPNGTGSKPYIEVYYQDAKNRIMQYHHKGASKTDFGALLEGVNDVVFNAEHLGNTATDNFLKRFKAYGFYLQKQYTNERGERQFILMIRDGSKSGNVEMIPERKGTVLRYTVLTKNDEKTILETKNFEKIDDAQAYMDFKRRRLNEEVEYGRNIDSGIPDGSGNRNTEMGDAGRTEGAGRDTGMDDGALERGRENTDRANSVPHYVGEFQPHSQGDEQRGSTFVGGPDEPQNGKISHRGTSNIDSDQPRNGSVNAEGGDQPTVGAVKRIREQCLTLLNEKSADELTAEDKKVLARYEGGGGTGETERSASEVLYAFYTPKAVCDTLWRLVDAYAPDVKTVLEPAGGTGRFLEGRELNDCTLIEPDETASRIARLLHPAAHVKTQSFQELFFKDGVIHRPQYTEKPFDLVIGNPPYGVYSGFYKGKGEGASHSRYEQYFLDRALDVVKDGGLVAFVLPSSFLQSAETEGKRLIAAKGTLIDAWRLPSGVFPTTDVGVDLVIVKKERGYEKDFSLDSFFTRHPDHVLGEEKEGVNRFGRKEIKVIPFEGETLEATLARVIPENMLKLEKEEPPLQEAATREALQNETQKTQEQIMRENVEMAQALADSIPVEPDGSFSQEKQAALARMEYLRMHYLTVTGMRQQTQNDTAAAAAAKQERTRLLKKHADSKNEYILTLIAQKEGYIDYLEDCKSGTVKDPYREHETLITETVQAQRTQNETRKTVHADILENEPIQSAHAPQARKNIPADEVHAKAPIKEATTKPHTAQTQKAQRQPVPNNDKMKRHEGKLLSASEFAAKYGKTLDEREAPLWKATDYEGKIDAAALTDEQKAFIAQHPDYIKISETAWMHTVNFTKGNIYEKLEVLEKNKESIGDALYQKQKEMLEHALPPEVPYEKLTIPVHSNLAHEFIVARDDNGVPYNLREGFIKWATGEQFLFEAGLPLSHPSRVTLNDESPVRPEDFPAGIYWSSIVSYIDRDPVRAHQEYTPQKKKAAQLEANRTRTLRRETAERLFNRYIQEGVPEGKRSELLKAWNRRFNGYRAADYAKLPLFVSGMSEKKDGEVFTLYEQQIKGISFSTDKGNGILAYDVGVGKTACGIVATVNQIQAERAHCPLICVPKTVYSKWLHDIKELFPTIPVNDLGNFSEEKLKPFLVGEHGLSLEKGSISLCTHEALQAITFKKQTLEGDLTVDLLDARSTVSGNAWDNAQEKEEIQKILGEASSVKNGYVYWENTGFDHITVDEAHRFKNLFTMPRPQYDDGAKRQANEFEGIGSGTPSKRAQKLFAITQLIQKENNGRNVFLLTATPFTNSPTEIYSMLSYVGREKLKRMHLYNLGSFMTEFAETHTEWAVKPNGEIQPKQVMKNFRNVQSLQNLLTEYIDKVGAEEAGVIRPIKRVHAIELEATELQKKIIEAETARLSTISKDDPGGVLVAMNNMRMALLSPALVKASNYDFALPPMSELVESSPKLTFVCNAIAASYKKVPAGGQVMYMPRGVQEAEEVKRYLIAHGVPEKAIGIINSGTSSKKKDEMTEQFNDKTAPLKIIIGSETISEGIDLNGNSFALYNCMLGWNPTESTQVEGRIWRQGNEQGHVHITYPLITDSIDSLMYQKHDEKSSRINALWSYKGDVLDVQDIRPEELKLDLIKDPEKKASFIISRKKAALEGDRAVIDLKLSTIDSIIEKKHAIAINLAAAERCDAKGEVRFYKTKLQLLEKKEAACDIDSEHSAAMRIAELNEEKRKLTERIDSIEKEKPRLIAEAKKAQTAERSLAGSLADITENYVQNLLNDLKPMAEVRKEIELDRKRSALSTKEVVENIPNEKILSHKNVEISLEAVNKTQSVQPIIAPLRSSSGSTAETVTRAVSGTVNTKATQKSENQATLFERAVPSCYARIGGRTLSVQSLAQLQTHFSFRTVASNNTSPLQPHEITAVAHAFADMADVLHLPDKQIGVFSTLALSLAGTQQKRSGTHYDRNKQTLSLMHGKSGGLLAEKWFSAFDNLLYSAATGQKKDVCLTEIPQGKGKINQAFQNLITAITEKEDKTPSDYLRHAQLLDGKKAAHPYWARKQNLAARAFSAYVSDKLESLGRKNTLLCFKSDNTFYKTRTPAQGVPKPYPEGAERARINKAFDALFDAQRQFLYMKEHRPLVAQTVKSHRTVTFER
ncbi:N-6 DNA methylase [Treponema sp. OMZ 803]|uniref:LPD1 domain-containing protein n=1 Tax=Treponema sp. OMZ 803 TaxID=120682 RepID=UPI0020A24884|nr:LPD1 domain-containing protein [Treponema sp. OMZ 803]UTC53938.1 N-6 DNA methylase [Treponema sp. OMZ 803]